MAFYSEQGYNRKSSRNVIASAAFRQAIAYMRHGGVLHDNLVGRGIKVRSLILDILHLKENTAISSLS